MDYATMKAGLAEIKDSQAVVEQHAQTVSDLFEICIRNVSRYRLKRIKRALQNFDALRGEWKS